MLKERFANHEVTGHCHPYQVLRYLELALNNEEDLATLCRLESADSLQFPSADYRYVQAKGQDNFKLEFNFMGLLGVDSALPTFFNDLLCIHPDERQRIKDFIGIFSHHLYLLYYQAWKSQRPEIQIEQGCQQWFELLQHLIPHVPVRTGSALCSDFIANHKNQLSVRHIIKVICPEFNFVIKEVADEWVSHQVNNQLGETELCLGENSFIGEQFLVSSQTVHVEFQQITQASLPELLALVPTLLKVLTNYLDIFQKLKMTAIVQISPAKIVLGYDTICLGSLHYINDQAMQMVVDLC